MEGQHSTLGGPGMSRPVSTDGSRVTPGQRADEPEPAYSSAAILIVRRCTTESVDWK